jgi:hypothetical protein
MAARRKLDPGEVLYEFIHIGGSVKVTAVDPESMAEVSIVGSPLASEAYLMRLARRKLEFVLVKQGKIDPPGG